MRLILILFSLGIAAVTLFTCKSSITKSAPSLSKVDSLEIDRNKWIAQIKDEIKGKEDLPVDSMFSNLKVLGGFPAKNLVIAMESWSKALGVSCGHCHNTSNFSSDINHKKKIAREMVVMGNMIGAKLKTIEGISERPIVNCTTCHRGKLKPAYRLTN